MEERARRAPTSATPSKAGLLLGPSGEDEKRERARGRPVGGISVEEPGPHPKSGYRASKPMTSPITRGFSQFLTVDAQGGIGEFRERNVDLGREVGNSSSEYTEP